MQTQTWLTVATIVAIYATRGPKGKPDPSMTQVQASEYLQGRRRKPW